MDSRLDSARCGWRCLLRRPAIARTRAAGRNPPDTRSASRGVLAGACMWPFVWPRRRGPGCEPPVGPASPDGSGRRGAAGRNAGGGPTSRARRARAARDIWYVRRSRTRTISESPTAVPDAPIRRTEIYRVAKTGRFTVLAAGGALWHPRRAPFSRPTAAWVGMPTCSASARSSSSHRCRVVVHEVEPARRSHPSRERYQVDIEHDHRPPGRTTSASRTACRWDKSSCSPAAELPNTPFAGYAWTSSSGESTIPASGSFVWPTAGVISQGGLVGGTWPSIWPRNRARRSTLFGRRIRGGGRLEWSGLWPVRADRITATAFARSMPI